MITLEQLAQQNPDWSLKDFVQTTNELLPQFLPAEKSHTKIREQVTPRLVRHYTTIGLLDEPHKAGRKSFYGYRHLLQLLVIRRLMVEGYGASAINNLARTSDNASLAGLLVGGVQLSVTVANPALAFLQEIQQRSGKTPSFASSSGQLRTSNQALPSPSPVVPAASHWTRLEILPGLEIQVDDGFQYPASSHERRILLDTITQKLEDIAKKRRSSK